ncbi:uncharacterized protein MJAP1_004072 [Malassezia japonica]|uniref:PHD-type domain-containing protein n=1 Tax=Malassezia japonica TaxID=223818 RepID=A0AAF0F5S5_9BASI|nr:uncharacterized protein MJAP1_004072 [Malassezia japonica]WFD41079.1 hypothetical protein MJAP1_004072 [Malassezia japonica]
MATWGRVLLTGSVPAPDGTWENIASPAILRGLSNVRVQQIGASASSQHALFLTLDGDVYVYGANGAGQCGLDARTVVSEPHKLDRQSDFRPPLAEGETVVHVAAGAEHSLLATSYGHVYATGSNSHGQCGLGSVRTASPFTRLDPVPFGEDRAWQVGCGRTFGLILGESGKVYAMGSTIYGQLGTDELGAEAVSASAWQFRQRALPVPLALENVIQIACGATHAVALDTEHFVYTWGENRFGRLGCGTQRDQMAPVRVEQFASKPKHARVQRVVAGRDATVCLDLEQNYWIAGRTRVTGDGGLGQGYYIFKPLAALEELDTYKAALGVDGLYCAAGAQGEGARAYAWGQGASHGELGVRRAPADPAPLASLREVAVVDVASAAHTSFWLVEPGKAYGELPRLPHAVDSADACLVCHAADDEAQLLACDKCENPYHLGCLRPKLAAIPDDEWFCDACGGTAAAGPPVVSAPRKRRRR